MFQLLIRLQIRKMLNMSERRKQRRAVKRRKRHSPGEPQPEWSVAVCEYVFSVFDESLPLSARDERGEGRGGGSPSLTQRCDLLSPALSSPGEERE